MSWRFWNAILAAAFVPKPIPLKIHFPRMISVGRTLGPTAARCDRNEMRLNASHLHAPERNHAAAGGRWPHAALRRDALFLERARRYGERIRAVHLQRLSQRGTEVFHEFRARRA